MPSREECAIIESHLLGLLAIRGLQDDSRADGLRVSRLADQSQLQPVIAVDDRVAVGRQVPRESVLGILLQLFSHHRHSEKFSFKASKGSSAPIVSKSAQLAIAAMYFAAARPEAQSL
jgi:hypothetical protein